MTGPASDPNVRKGIIGGTDGSKILGVNPWGTKLSVAMEKRGELPPPDLSDNDAVHFGIVLEQVVADEYVRRSGNKVRKSNQTLRDPEFPFIAGHIDRRVVGGGILECKTAGAYCTKEWGEEGTDDVPMHYVVQCRHYLMLTREDWCDLAVLIGGRDFRTYRIERDIEWEKGYRQLLVSFWQRHVVGDETPDPQNAHDVLLLYPDDNAQTVMATEGAQVAHNQLAGVKQRIKELKVSQEELEFVLKEELGEAQVLLGPIGKLCTWKTQESTRLDSKRLKVSAPDIYREYAAQSSSRVFRLTGGA